jgi:hypothetical protein
LKPKFAIIYPSLATYIWLPWLQPERPRALPRFDVRIKDPLKNVLKPVVPQTVQNWLRRREIERDVPRYGTVMDSLPEENIQRFTDDMRGLASALRSHGIEPVLVTHAHRFNDPPTKDDLEFLTSWRKFYPMLSERGFLDMENRMNNALRSLAASEQYTIIDAGRRIPPGPQNFADFTHFTDEGATLMAKVLAKDLYPLVDPQP